MYPGVSAADFTKSLSWSLSFLFTVSFPFANFTVMLCVVRNVRVGLVDVSAIASELVLRGGNLIVYRMQPRVNLPCGVHGTARKCDLFCNQLMIGVIGALDLYRQARDEGSDAEVLSIE